MINVKHFQFISYIVYGIIASIGSKFLNIHWIHLLNALILSAILWQILDWRYGYTEEEDNDETNDN